MRSPASQGRSIKHKLTVAFMITSLASLLMACAGFVAYELITFRRTMTNDLTTNANIIVSNSTAPLAFEDRDAAKETLGTLRSRPRIVSAAIYQEQKGLFAAYVREGWRSTPPPRPGPDGCRFENGYLILLQPIGLGGKRIATLYIQSDLEAMRARFRSYAWIVLLVLLTSVLAAFVVSRILQRRITYPIGKLAETIRGVAHKKDYSLRAHKYSNDELGLFAEAFNEMLGRIEERDATLQKSNQALTEEVAERRRAEADLIESGRRFRFLADAMPQIVWTADSKGNADYYNERWYDYTGFSRDETSGSSWETALLPEEREL